MKHSIADRAVSAAAAAIAVLIYFLIVHYLQPQSSGVAGLAVMYVVSGWCRP